MKLLDLLKGETLSARNALDDLSASIGEERILWYPSAGRDYRDILETMPERLPMHGIYGPGPNLFCHTDYQPFWGIEKDFTETLFSDANTWITILERHPVAFREEAGVRYGVDPDHVSFFGGALPAPRIELMKVRAISRQLGQATVPLLYFFFENHNFMHEVVLKHRLRIPWFVKVREGCGFGGCRKCISPFYTRLGDTGTEYMLVDEEIHLDERDRVPGQRAFELERLDHRLYWSGYSVYPYRVRHTQGQLTREQLDGALRLIHGNWGGSMYT